MILKEKSIYHAMNEFNYDVGRKLLIAEGWCPKTATDKIVNALRVATEKSGAQVPSVMSVVHTNEEPPTYFQTNKWTSSFQAIVEAYGVAQYQEVNPGTCALFCICNVL
jgi:V-type H+-transporting ATPase subunit a